MSHRSTEYKKILERHFNEINSFMNVWAIEKSQYGIGNIVNVKDIARKVKLLKSTGYDIVHDEPYCTFLGVTLKDDNTYDEELAFQISESDIIDIVVPDLSREDILILHAHTVESISSLNMDRKLSFEDRNRHIRILEENLKKVLKKYNLCWCRSTFYNIDEIGFKDIKVGDQLLCHVDVDSIQSFYEMSTRKTLIKGNIYTVDYLRNLIYGIIPEIKNEIGKPIFAYLKHFERL